MIKIYKFKEQENSQIIDLKQELLRIDQEIADIKIRQLDTDDSNEKESLSAQIDNLKAEKEDIQSDIESLKQQESFKFNNLSGAEQEKLFSEFEKSYIKATGASWDKNHFLSRAYNWTFFGDENGGIAVRKQRSGLYKLVASYGSPKKIISAFKEMQNEIGNEPIWGAMTLNLANMLEKLTNNEFKIAPKLFVKTLIPKIKHIFGDDILGVKKDGAIIVNTPAGKMEKYFIYNKAYAAHMIDQLKNHPEKLPVPNALITILLPIVKKMI